MEDGKFVDSKLNGHGKVTYANVKFNGMVYDGEWKDGKKNGYGIITHNGPYTLMNNFWLGTLECTWKDDWPDNGPAKRTRDSVNVYEGQWASDKGGWGGPSCKGKVKYTYKNGDIYEGDCSVPNRNSKGKYFTPPGGNKQDAEFSECNRHGDGKYTYL